jgi:hypothetical protein
MRLCSGLTLAAIGICGASAKSEPASPQANESLTIEGARVAALQVCGQHSNDLNACVVATTRLIFADRRNKGFLRLFKVLLRSATVGWRARLKSVTDFDSVKRGVFRLDHLSLVQRQAYS